MIFTKTAKKNITIKIHDTNFYLRREKLIARVKLPEVKLSEMKRKCCIREFNRLD